MPLELYFSVLFISLTQSVNGAQFLNITYASAFATDIVPLTSIYASFILTQIFVLHLER